MEFLGLHKFKIFSLLSAFKSKVCWRNKLLCEWRTFTALLGIGGCTLIYRVANTTATRHWPVDLIVVIIPIEPVRRGIGTPSVSDLTFNNDYNTHAPFKPAFTVQIISRSTAIPHSLGIQTLSAGRIGGGVEGIFSFVNISNFKRSRTFVISWHWGHMWGQD